MEGLQAELEQYKQQNRDLENTLAQANEEQEALAAQLYETGHALDEANNEVTTPLTTAEQSTCNISLIYIQVQHKEHELDQMKSVISSKEQEVARLKQQGIVTIKNLSYVTVQIILVAELEKLQEKLMLSEHELQTARYWNYYKDA